MFWGMGRQGGDTPHPWPLSIEWRGVGGFKTRPYKKDRRQRGKGEACLAPTKTKFDFVLSVRKMKYNPDIHHRRSIRLKEYDYARAGAYFVTILAGDRENLFGDVVDGTVRLSKIGEIVDECWIEIPRHFPDVELDTYVIMPNHIHGALVVGGVGATHASPLQKQQEQGLSSTSPLQRHPQRVSGRPTGTKPRSVGAIIGSLKSAATRRINQFRHTIGFVVWQRNYYEHIIRNEKSMNKIREYIFSNPLRWEFDRENPDGRPDKIEKDFWIGV